MKRAEPAPDMVSTSTLTAVLLLGMGICAMGAGKGDGCGANCCMANGCAGDNCTAGCFAWDREVCAGIAGIISTGGRMDAESAGG